MSRKSVLMLQGHPSRFWGELADALVAQGHAVTKVNFCLADRLFWGRRKAISYRGRLANWPARLCEICAAKGITDILYYADQLPYHIAAREMAAKLGLRAFAIEFGYLRPDWLTFERDGMGRMSHFPRDREAVTALAAQADEPDMEPRYLHGFAAEAFGEVSFNLAMVFGRPFYPFYRSDKLHSPLVDYIAWLPLLISAGRDRRHADRVSARLLRDRPDFNLVAMQMRDDYQIRGSSCFHGLEDFLDEVLASFAAHAPQTRELVIKLHPLESALPHWGARIRHLVARHGLTDRVSVIRGGDLHQLLSLSQGVVLVNSTVGLHALAAQVPVIALGDAVYALPGLTHQGGLDQFWTAPEPIDQAYFAAFRRALTTVQVKGSFYNPAGRKRAVAEIVFRLTSGHESTGFQ